MEMDHSVIRGQLRGGLDVLVSRRVSHIVLCGGLCGTDIPLRQSELM